jgi:hypothetical protein
MYLDNLIPELSTTAHSCGQHGPATAWLTSEQPDNVVLVPKNTCSVWCMSTLFLAIKSVC